MLNDGDIDFIHGSRDEILSHRERLIDVIYLDTEHDPLTGMPIGEGESYRKVTAVITEISSAAGAGVERTIEGGIKYDESDIKADIKIELIEDIIRKIERLEYDDVKYEILAVDKKGIGRRNRYEIIGREIS